MTAYAIAGGREKYLEEGMNGYVAKPMEMEMLLKVVEEVMAKAQV